MKKRSLALFTILATSVGIVSCERLQEQDPKIVSIVATDNGTYNEDSVYSQNNNLIVRGYYEDEETLPKIFDTNEYTYKVFNSSGTQIQNGQPFGDGGEFTVNVNYGSLTSSITLDVARVTKLLSVKINLTTTTAFETNNVFSTIADSVFSVNLNYNHSEVVNNVKYSQLASKNLTFTLTDPSGTVKSEKSAFGTEGTWTIKVQSKDNPSISDTKQFTVVKSIIKVTSITLSKTSLSLYTSETSQLSVSVLPSDATDKSVTWSSSNSAVATVSSAGLVTAVAVGSATITVSANDGSGIKKTCSVSVAKKPAGSDWILVNSTSELENGDTIVIASSSYAKTATTTIITSSYTTYLSPVTSTFDNDIGVISSLGSNTAKFVATKSSSSWTLSCTSGNLGATAAKKLAFNSGTTTWNISISDGKATISSTTSSYGQLLFNYNSGSSRFANYTSTSDTIILPQIYKLGKLEPIYPTAISLDKTTADVNIGGNTSLTVTYSPKNANTGKSVTWSSNNTNVATVNNGTVTVKSTATAGQTATITATCTNSGQPTLTATCKVTVVEQKLDAWTIMIYMCGADLESDNGLATMDINEILSVSGQPDDVNIIIETGGANVSSSKGYFSSSQLRRYHVENQSMVLDKSLTYANMGLSSTLKDFIVWGAQTYPAEKTGLIFWNHGGGMYGVCYDELEDDDSLYNSEVKSAMSSAFSTLGRTTKFEWVGYDACLMAVQDIAIYNSEYFNYMVSSEESESGYGWDYDNWVDDLYAKKDTTTILKAICDSFIAEQGSSSDQTLSYLNLSYASSYKTAWENMATQLKSKITSSNKDSFKTLVKSAKHYADSDYTYFALFDAKDFVNKLSSNSTFNPGSTYTSAVLDAFSNFVAYSKVGTGAGKSYGLCMFYPVSSSCYAKTVYSTSETSFTNWRYLAITYGTYYS